MKNYGQKLTLLFSTLVICSTVSVFAEPNNILPVGCSDKPCTKVKQECPQNCNSAPVFDSCDDLSQWRTKYCEKRANLYDKLCLTQEQRVKAKIIDDKYFDIIAPLKLCCKQEKAKLKEMECNKSCTLKQKREQKQKIKDIKAEIKDKRNQHKECFIKLLTCEQRDKYNEIKKDKCKKHKKTKCECDCK